jgi:hypothetical protein
MFCVCSVSNDGFRRKICKIFKAYIIIILYKLFKQLINIKRAKNYFKCYVRSHIKMTSKINGDCGNRISTSRTLLQKSLEENTVAEVI